MILAMNVVGYRTTYRNVARTRYYRQKPAARQHDLRDIGECRAAFAGEYAVAIVE